MHEASMMRGLMRKIEQVAAEQQAARVTSVDVWLGALSHMSDSHFREHFVQASANGIAQGATISTELSDDITHPNAEDVLLRGVEVET